MSTLRALLRIKLIMLLLGWIQLPYIDRYRINHNNFGIDVIILHTSIWMVTLVLTTISGVISYFG
jgi:hypothetical protein